MAQKSWFFNSAPGDPRVYQASDFAQYFGKVLSTGLLHVNEVPGLNVKAGGTDLRTYVEPGSAIMEGYAYENTANEYLSHSLPEVSLDRIDRVVLRLDKKNANRHIKLFVREGEPASSPVPPTLQRDSLVWELSLAQVRIRANTSTISPTDVFDERLDRTVAGLTFSLISKPSMADIQTGGYAVVATTEGQTDFEIPLSSFDKVGDGLTVYVGGKKAEYSSYEVVYPRTVRFNAGLSIGTKVEFEIIRGVLKLADDYVVTAGEVGMVDAGGYYESENVEGALQKIGLSLFKPKPIIYGIEIDEYNSNPSTAVSYIEDAANLNITNYSDWDNVFPFNAIKPCLIRTITNEFVTYLNPNNYAQNIGGSPVDITSLLNGDVFVEIPTIWWNFKRVGSKLQIRISSEKVNEEWVALAHQVGNNIIPKLYIGAYGAYKDVDNRLRSISGKNKLSRSDMGTAGIGEKDETANGYAKANNCTLINFYAGYTLPNILYMLRYRSMDFRLLGSPSTALLTGVTNTVGMYSENNAVVDRRSKFLGVEDLGSSSPKVSSGFTKRATVVAGILPMGNDTSGRTMAMATDNYTFDGSVLKDNYWLVDASGIIASAPGYMTLAVGNNELSFFPRAKNGSLTTYYGTRTSTMNGTVGDETMISIGQNVGTSQADAVYRICYRPLTKIN